MIIESLLKIYRSLQVYGKLLLTEGLLKIYRSLQVYEEFIDY